MENSFLLRLELGFPWGKKVEGFFCFLLENLLNLRYGIVTAKKKKVYIMAVSTDREGTGVEGARRGWGSASVDVPDLQVPRDQRLYLLRVRAHVALKLVVVLEGDEGGHGLDAHVRQDPRVPDQVGVQEDDLRVPRGQALVELPHRQAARAVAPVEADDQQLTGAGRGQPAPEVVRSGAAAEPDTSSSSSSARPKSGGGGRHHAPAAAVPSRGRRPLRRRLGLLRGTTTTFLLLPFLRLWFGTTTPHDACAQTQFLFSPFFFS